MNHWRARCLLLKTLYRQKVTELAAALDHADEGQREPARDSLRGFITAIVIPPDGLLQVHGDLGRMLTDERRPVRPHKGPPRHRALPTRRNPLRLEDAGDR